MSRDLTVAATTAVTGEVVTRTMAVELQFPSAFVRFTGAPYDLTIDGSGFVTVGALGSISAVEEGGDLRSYGLVIVLTGIPRDIVSTAFSEDYQGRRATVWEVPIDPASNLPIADPFIIFRGRMDQMDVELGDTASISVRVENRLADWERPRLRRYTSQDQWRDYPADQFFQFVPAVVEKEIRWPAGTFRE